MRSPTPQPTFPIKAFPGHSSPRTHVDPFLLAQMQQLHRHRWLRFHEEER